MGKTESRKAGLERCAGGVRHRIATVTAYFKVASDDEDELELVRGALADAAEGIAGRAGLAGHGVELIHADAAYDGQPAAGPPPSACPACGGHGLAPAGRCAECSGLGWVM